MIFPSYVFLFAFLPIVLAFWLSRLRLDVRLALLTLASYVFYGWWDYRFVTLLLASTLVDYFCGLGIDRSQDRGLKRRILAVSLVTNLSFLGFFKYYDFFVESAATAMNSVGLSVQPLILNIVLPIGISFYTFQSISYSLDIYRGNAKPAPDFLHFAAYVALFPQLVAGPIVRYEQMALQLRELRGKLITAQEFVQGTWFFVIGLAKKLLIADQVAPLAERLFDGTGTVQTGAAWAGSLAYTLQLYFDFSGYSDMAVGLGLMLGFRFPINFLSPYKARSISDFWNRWHITLSHFLRDYLYIPLGGSRGSLLKTVRNLAVTMFLGGLWHGAQWTFVVWGVYHGVLLAIYAVASNLVKQQLPRLAAIGVTFLAVHLGWVLFRAPTFERASEVYRGLLGLNGTEELFARTVQSATFGALPAFVDIFGGPIIFAFIAIGLTIAFLAPNSHELPRRFGTLTAVLVALAVVACIGAMGRETPFIYFQF